MIIEDPLNFQNLQVTDIASARYALKVANDQHFAILHMREQMQKELNRSAEEVFNQKWLLIKPYVLTDSDLEPRPFIPNPLPENVPVPVERALFYLDEQYNLEITRAEAELADQSDELYKIRDHLMELVKAWFISELQNGATWLTGNAATIGGCTLIYTGDDVTFDFVELDYE